MSETAEHIPRPNCAQIPYAVLDNLKRFTPAQGIILVYLSMRTFGVGRIKSNVRISAIHRGTGISIRCIQSCLKVLTEAELLVRIENFSPDNGARLADTYALNVDKLPRKNGLSAVAPGAGFAPPPGANGAPPRCKVCTPPVQDLHPLHKEPSSLLKTTLSFPETPVAPVPVLEPVAPAHSATAVAVYAPPSSELSHQPPTPAARTVPLLGPFDAWWPLWSGTMGTNHRQQALDAFRRFVTRANVDLCFRCTASYVASRDDPRKGYNPENFLREQAQDGFTALWPEAPRPASRGPSVERLADLMRPMLARQQQ